MKWGHELPQAHDLSSLRLLGSVGEPINPEAWMWYQKIIGGERCPIVDTWWQTETGAILITPLPGLVATKPGSATKRVSRHRREDPRRGAAMRSKSAAAISPSPVPWPSMLRGIWRDPDRLRAAVLVEVAGHLLHRRRRQARRRRLLLAPRPRRRRHQRRRPSHRHDGSGVGARRSPVGRRGRGGRHQSRDQGDGDRGIRDRESVAAGSRRNAIRRSSRRS